MPGLVNALGVLVLGAALVAASGYARLWHACKEHKSATTIRTLCMITGALCLAYAARVLV